ncbi:killer cell lectin-like receptor subfamily G member 2 isoform X1 [Equus quagga]|uniref:killer cell lectin-like receptor subfamily G member 2 isoform X1 n=1 Tax=Equus quagga TaxID=89248 RepID=UPI001EE1D9C9|nr:killer cell lectin-like receptor subfamily G member 2 isoform X1 [Equus quagga]
MECARAASGGGQAGAEVPMEPLGSQVPEVEQPQVPAGERGPGSPASSPISARAAKEAAGAGQDLSGGRKLPSPRPALLRVPPPSLGYGAFRRQTSSGPEPPSPGPSAAQQSRDGEAPGAELAPWAAQGEPAPGAWAPMELQVDVRVKPVGAAGGSRAPSPAPSTRFLTVPVPESPGFSRHTSPAYPLLSPGGTWGRAAPLAPARAERGHDAEGRASPAEGRAESPGSPTCRCRCRELGLEKREDAVLLPRADADCDWKLPRAVTLVGLPMYLKSLRWALIVMALLLAVSAVAIVALASRAGARCRPCPQGWMWSEEHCYYLSADTQAWEASQAFCAAHHATLPLLSHTQDFLSRYPVTKYSWVGARRGPQGWHWIDGAPLPPQLVPVEDEDEPDLKCGGLERGKLVALDCASPRPWVCAKGTE